MMPLRSSLRGMRVPVLRLLLVPILALSWICVETVFADASAAAEPAVSEMVASIKESGNVLLYSENQVRNRLPISLETIRLSATDQVEIIDVRDFEGRLLKFAQDMDGGRNNILIQPREPVPVNESMKLFTVSLHKNLVQKRKDTLVFEYEYTPDFPTSLKYTAIVPPSAHVVNVEPEPKEQAGRRFSWEFRLEANQPFACRIKYSQEAHFGLAPVTDEEDLEQFAGSTYGGWRGNNIGVGWAWFHKGIRPHKNLIMPRDFRLAIKMNTLSAIDEKRRFGLMLDSTDIISFERGEEIKDPWGRVAYCFFWSNCDIEKGFAYGVLRNGKVVKSEQAPQIELKTEYEIALEKEGNRFRLFVDGENVLEYEDPALLESRHGLKFGVHGPMSWKQIKALSKDKKYKNRLREIIDNLEWTFVRYSKPDFTLIGAEKELLEYRLQVEEVDTINTFSDHVMNTIYPIIRRMNGFDECDFSPNDSASIEEVSNIDLSKLGFKTVSSEPFKQITIGNFHYDVSPEERSNTRRVSYSRQGSHEPVLFLEMGRAESEIFAVEAAFAIRQQVNWGAYNAAPFFSQAFYPHLASLGMRKGRWLIHISLPLKEGEASELDGKWDTIRLFLRSIAGQILMHFYEMDMSAQ
ncbi:MAG: hypothetical protein JSV16_07590 [Candidatus Hydrogenedentota bacterium]|nr:MAG: hypothetical protein JSV16_07590 [Candidatus Hydrogenedentota bacterium]